MHNKNKRLATATTHTIETNQLLIRPLTLSDQLFYCQLYSDKKVMRHIKFPLTDNKAQQLFFTSLNEMQNKRPKMMTWVILNKKNHSLIGIQGLTINYDDQSAEMGIMLAKQYIGNSFATKAVTALRAYAVKDLSLSHFFALYAKNNIAAARVLHCLGFEISEKQSINDKTKVFWNYQPVNEDKAV